jgi:hypothetical protein
MAKRDLTKEQLSRSFSVATIRIHELVDEFYEGLHMDDGSPCINPGTVANMLTVLRVQVEHELDLIKEASYQHFEANYDEGKQAEILFGDGEGS